MTIERTIQPIAVVKVPCDIQRFAQNARHGHFIAEAKVKKQARGIGYLAWVQAGKPMVTMPATVHVLVRRPRRLDKINVPGALKSIIDGIVGDGMQLNDDQLDIAAPIEFETGAAWKGKEEVILTFRAAAPGEETGERRTGEQRRPQSMKGLVGPRRRKR